MSGKAKQVQEPFMEDNVNFFFLVYHVTSEYFYLVYVLNVLGAINDDNTTLKNDYGFNSRI